LEVPTKRRLVGLISFLLRELVKVPKALVFFSSSDSVDFHFDLLSAACWPGMERSKKEKPSGPRFGAKGEIKMSDSESEEEEDEEDETGRIFAGTQIFKLHGNLTADQRAGFIKEFRKAPKAIMLATDVAARGLDIPTVGWIVQYDPPTAVEEYLQRVGRTARLGKAGNACLFLLPSETEYLEKLRVFGVELGTLDFQEIVQHALVDNEDAPDLLRKVKEAPAFLNGQLAHFVEANEGLLKLARQAYLASTRAYQTFPRELKSIFNVKALHTGHFASSFALKEPPKKVQQVVQYGEDHRKISSKWKKMPGMRLKELSQKSGTGKGDGKGGGKGGEKKLRMFSAADEFAM